MSQLLLGLGDALRVDVVLFVFLGVLLGYVVGVLPGLNRPAALAIAVPLSYYMTPLSAVAFLIGIAKASGAGGATTAILINTPLNPIGRVFDREELETLARVVKETENLRLGTSARSRFTRVDLPDPDGAEMMKTVVSALLQI